MAFIEHKLPCPSCGGSDPVSLNEDGSAWCFSCETRLTDYQEACDAPFSEPTNIKTYKDTVVNNIVQLPSDCGKFLTLTDRNITQSTAKKYGVRAVDNFDKVITKHLYPYYINNEIAAYKIREENKTFSWRGNPRGTGLFGEQLFKSGGKYITLVEGECDAMAAYELLGSKWPVVSIKNGAAGAVKDVKQSLEFLEKFDSIVINFDGDRQGREAAKKVARLLTPGKAKILNLPEEFKDANDVLLKGNHRTYVTAWWDSKIYTPSGILSVSNNLDKLFNREIKASVPYPWEGLNLKLYGIRMGELVTLTGGTGLGKSSITRELEHWLLKQTEDNIGIISLEEGFTRTSDGILSIAANARLFIDHVREEYGSDNYKELTHKVFKGEDNKQDRVFIYSHFGANDIDEIFSKIRFMIIGCDCKWVVIDHLHMLVSTSTEGDERRTIDSIMTKLRSIVEETGVGMILVSHLRRVDGNRGHENGVSVGLNHLRGSQSIAQLSDCVIALERNQQATDIQEAHTTHLRILKSRYTGDVGMATHLLYNRDTGRLSEIDLDDIDYDDGDEL